VPVKNIIPGQKINREKLQRAHELRREMRPAEKALRQELRGNKPAIHFRRQEVIAGFTADFYCHAAGVIIEMDGDVHKERQDYDADRDKVLEGMGLRVIHFKNDDVLKNLPKVLNRIIDLLPAE
jgi:very-short-patch-repair endonuclease